MLGVKSAQRGLLEADHLYLDHVGRGSFYGFLASMRGQPAAGSPTSTAPFMLAAASWIAISLSPVRWLSLTLSRHRRAFQPGF